MTYGANDPLIVEPVRTILSQAVHDRARSVRLVQYKLLDQRGVLDVYFTLDGEKHSVEHSVVNVLLEDRDALKNIRELAPQGYFVYRNAKQYGILVRETGMGTLYLKIREIPEPTQQIQSPLTA
ncbi:MAG: hypothetical protein HYW23_02115 [Candidatus Aenigmarchaeota archaeon]|nr:hypothetical protein [Candidatus Aenigmarchaeota archaeon]